MSYYNGGWAPYVPVQERQRQAERAVAKLRKSGTSVTPVTIEGRLIATTVWGQAWCQHLERYRDYETRLPRGRSYVRNGSVIDLKVAAGRVTALVNGSELYRVTITIKETAKTIWKTICTDCAGGIDTLVELLQGHLSTGVMARICRQDDGLFPKPSDIRFSCSCPDHAMMCKHVAAALYGIGARLDHAPELLFRLRAVDERDLVTRIEAGLSPSRNKSAKVLQGDDMAGLFGLDLMEPVSAAPPREKPPPSVRGRKRAGLVVEVPAGPVSRIASPPLAVRGSPPITVRPRTKQTSAANLAEPKPGRSKAIIRRLTRKAALSPLPPTVASALKTGVGMGQSATPPSRSKQKPSTVRQGERQIRGVMPLEDDTAKKRSLAKSKIKAASAIKEPQPVKWWLTSSQTRAKKR